MLRRTFLKSGICAGIAGFVVKTSQANAHDTPAPDNPASDCPSGVAHVVPVTMQGTCTGVGVGVCVNLLRRAAKGVYVGNLFKGEGHDYPVGSLVIEVEELNMAGDLFQLIFETTCNFHMFIDPKRPFLARGLREGYIDNLVLEPDGNFHLVVTPNPYHCLFKIKPL